MYANDYDENNPLVVELDGYLDTTQRSTSILSYEITGEVETGGIIHNLLQESSIWSWTTTMTLLSHFSDAALLITFLHKF